MKLNKLFLILFTCMLFLSSCAQQEEIYDEEEELIIEEEPVEEEPTIAEEEQQTTQIIDITSQGFSPSSLTINVGDTVMWNNEDNQDHWPASAVHPTHTVYPGSSLCEGFDSCSISSGGSWSFTFNEVGEWGYHDHLSPGKTGKIIVE